MSYLRLLFLLFCFSIQAQLKAEDNRAFEGFITSPVGQTPFMVDGRPLLLSPTTRYACGPISVTIDTKNNVPSLPVGAKVAVVGKWDIKAAAWRTDQVCVLEMPPKTASGQGVLDAVSASGKDREWHIDGHRILLGPASNITWEPPLTGASVPAPGQWIQYTADRRPDGSWLLRNATVREYLDNRGARNERKWTPFALTVPSEGHDGLLKVAHLSPAIQLPGDRALQDRLARLGAAVVPAWQKALSALHPEERQFRFYAAKLHGNNCQPYPNGIVLVPEATAAALHVDAELAAVLAGCVAELQEEQAAQLVNKKLFGNTLATVSIVAISPAGLVGTAFYEKHMHHLQELMQQQSARVGLTYLEAAGYPTIAGPAAWEKLEGKHEEADLSRPPGIRTRLMYQALTEIAAEPPTNAQASATSMFK